MGSRLSASWTWAYPAIGGLSLLACQGDLANEERTLPSKPDASVSAGSGGASGSAGTNDSGAGGQSGGGASSGTGGQSGGGVSSGTGGQSIGFGATGGAGDDTDGGCVGTPSQAVNVETVVTHEVTHEVISRSPLDMYIMYDQSGSMDGDTPVGTKWDAIKAALLGFLNAPTSAGIGVGIGYFPFTNPAAPPTCFTDTDCGTYGPCVPVSFVGYCQGADACLPSQYSTPEVPIDLIPTVVPSITNSVNAHGPGGGTPTRPALEGAHIYAAQWAAAHLDRKTIVLLATDGDPSGCTVNGVLDSANIAAAALAATPSVPTFVVGVGSSLTSLDAIAASGGTGQASIVDAASGDPTQQFIDALNAIRDSVTTTTTEIVTEMVAETVTVPCEWLISAPQGIAFKADEVNVKLKAGAGAAEQTVDHVGGAGACTGVAGGWYYDDPWAPTKVLVCAQTCSMIQGLADAEVSFVFGCQTEEAIPR